MGLHDPVEHVPCPPMVRKQGQEALWKFLVESLARLGSLTLADSIYLECLVRPLGVYYVLSREATSLSGDARSAAERDAGEFLALARGVFEEYQEHSFPDFESPWDDWARLWNDLVTWQDPGGSK